MEITDGDYESPGSRTTSFDLTSPGEMWRRTVVPPRFPVWNLLHSFQNGSRISALRTHDASHLAHRRVQDVRCDRFGSHTRTHRPRRHRSTLDPQAPIQLEAEKHDHVPLPPPDFTASVLGRLLDRLGWLTEVGVPLPLGESGVGLVCDSAGDRCVVHQRRLPHQRVWGYSLEHWESQDSFKRSQSFIVGIVCDFR